MTGMTPRGLARRGRALSLIVAAAFWALGPGAAPAQDLGLAVSQGSVLVVDSEAAFAQSRMGQAASERIDTESRRLATENRRIEAELSAEERALTEQRTTTAPEAFRPLADAFDQKVRRIRDEQDAKAREIAQLTESARRDFLTAARPILREIMNDLGAGVILEMRAVFLVDEEADITAELIRRINAAADADMATTPQTGPGFGLGANRPAPGDAAEDAPAPLGTDPVGTDPARGGAAPTETPTAPLTGD